MAFLQHSLNALRVSLFCLLTQISALPSQRSFAPNLSPLAQSAPQKDRRKVVINNRPLVKIRKQTISLQDVVNKMNLFIRSQYPEHANNPQALYQLYQAHWKNTLRDLVHAELIVAYWEDKKFKLTDAEVHEEIEHRYGPNTALFLVKTGISYQDLFAIVERDLIVQQVSGYFVYYKVNENLRPESVKSAYQDYLAAFTPKEEWTYQTVTIKGADLSLCEEVADRFEKLLDQSKGALELLGARLTKECEDISEGAKVLISLEQTYPKSAIPKTHLAALEGCRVGELSSCIVEGSAKKPLVKRFLLKEIKKDAPATFLEKAEELREALFQKAYEAKMKSFMADLERQYGYTDPFEDGQIPKDYEPFRLA